MKQAGFPGLAAASLEEDERINFRFPKVGTDWISSINVKTQIRGLCEMKQGRKKKKPQKNKTQRAVAEDKILLSVVN